MRCIACSPLLAQVAPMLAKQIGENIRAAREAKGLTLEKVAARVKPPTRYQTIGRLEKAERTLTVAWIERIAKALEVDPVSLVAPELFTGAKAESEPGFHLDEQVANEAAVTLATVALQGREPEQGTVQAVALILQELTATFSKYPQAAADPAVARPAIDQLARRFAPGAH